MFSLAWFEHKGMAAAGDVPQPALKTSHHHNQWPAKNSEVFQLMHQELTELFSRFFDGTEEQGQ